jgi:hypothetical protein
VWWRAATSSVVNPFAVKDNTISSIPFSRRWRLLTICGAFSSKLSDGSNVSVEKSSHPRDDVEFDAACLRYVHGMTR